LVAVSTGWVDFDPGDLSGPVTSRRARSSLWGSRRARATTIGHVISSVAWTTVLIVVINLTF
jgi:hypothetical protein